MCPKGVDPAKAIQLMKRELVLDYFKLRKAKCPSEVAKMPQGIQRRPEVPDAPAKPNGDADATVDSNSMNIAEKL